MNIIKMILSEVSYRRRRTVRPRRFAALPNAETTSILYPAVPRMDQQRTAEHTRKRERWKVLRTTSEEESSRWLQPSATAPCRRWPRVCFPILMLSRCSAPTPAAAVLLCLLALSSPLASANTLRCSTVEVSAVTTVQHSLPTACRASM